MAAGYSGTPLWRKLGARPGHRVLLLGAPPGWPAEPGPPEVSVTSGPLGPVEAGSPGSAASLDLVVLFVRAAAELVGVPDLGRVVFPDGALWVAWPRRAAGHDSDVREDDVRAAALPAGLVDVKVAALDVDWSGLKLVWRRSVRPGR